MRIQGLIYDQFSSLLISNIIFCKGRGLVCPPEEVLEVLDVLDGEPEGLYLGEALAGRLEEGEALPQLRRTVHQLQ